MKNTKLIPLSQGKHAIVDDEDYDYLMQWKWCFCKGYAVRNLYFGKINNKENKIILHMHRVILSTHDGFEVDHINGDGLDNRRSNIRNCTRQQNRCNQKKRSNSRAKYKGLSWDKCNNKWRVGIRIGGKRVNIGRYVSEEDAAIAYNEAAHKYHGEFARLNII